MQVKEQGTKYDAEKPPVDLLDPHGLIEIAKVLAYGKKKYQAHNWRGGIAYSRLLAASLRHTLAYIDGEDLDPESGMSHVAHGACNLMFLLRMIKDRPDLDDRFKVAEK